MEDTTLLPTQDKIKIKIKIKRQQPKSLQKLDTNTIPNFATEAKILPQNIPTLQTNNHSVSATTNKKTQKRKKPKLSKQEKSKLWEIFETDKKEIDHMDQSSGELMREPPLECLYQQTLPHPINKGGITQEIKRELDLCELCDSTLIISDDGFPTCCNKKCGIIYKNTLDYSPEWRYYGAEDKNQKDPTRCGNPINPLLVESSFSCKVLLSSASSYEMRKIYKWTEWQSMPHKEKSLYDEFQFITIMAQNAGIPKIFIDDAISIHKDISEQKMFRGMNRDSIKAASIYISCRLNGCPRTAHEIAEIFILDKASATAGCSMAVKILNNIERKYETSEQTELCSTRPIAFIDRYCSKLNINGELTMLSKFIANKVESQNIINNNTPHAIAAGIVFFIAQNCNLNITKMDIKVVCGVSEVTINKCYKKLENMKERLIPNCILEKYL